MRSQLGCPPTTSYEVRKRSVRLLTSRKQNFKGLGNETIHSYVWRIVCLCVECYCRVDSDFCATT